MLHFVLFGIGIYLLIRGADWLVSGALNLAKHTGINDLLIGLSVVAFGTSLPELIKVIFFGGGSNSQSAIVSVLGINVANTLLVLGIIAVIKPIVIKRVTVYREVLFNVLAAVMLLVLAADVWFVNDSGFKGLDRIDGIVLISYLGLFLYYVYGRSTLLKKESKPLLSKAKSSSGDVRNIVYKTLLGAGVLTLGGAWVIGGMEYAADITGQSGSMLGLSMITIASCLPELATCLVAVKRKRTDLAFGTIIGSNLVNILLVLGLAAIIGAQPFGSLLLADTVICLVVALTLMIFTGFGRYKHPLGSVQGQFFILLYALFLVISPLI